MTISSKAQELIRQLNDACPLLATVGLGDLINELNDGAEPAFEKNTGFNKNFGKTSADVPKGNDGAQDLVIMGGALPTPADVASWPNPSFGFGRGTDFAIWLLFKFGTDTCWGIKLTDYGTV